MDPAAYLHAKLETSADTKQLSLFDMKMQAVGRSTKKTESQVNKFSKEVDRNRRPVDSLSGSLGNLNLGILTLRNLGKTLKVPAVIAAAGPAAEGVSALAAGATALAGSLIPVAGAGAAAASGIGAFVQVAGVAALAGVSDLTGAVGGLNEKLDEEADAFKSLSPEAQKFARELDAMKAPIKEIQSSVQKPLFRGLSEGMASARKNLPSLEKVLTQTSRVMGDLAARTGKFLGRESFGRDFEKLGQTNAQTLRRMGISGLNFADALRHVLVAARPLVSWMTKMGVRFSEYVEASAKAGRKSGDLAKFFDETKRILRIIVPAIGNFAKGLWNVMRAGSGLGNTLWRSLAGSAKEFRKWTESAKGKNTIAQWFKDAEGPLMEAGRLVRDLGAAFFELSSDKGGAGVESLIRSIRLELVPALSDIAKEGEHFGPVLIDFLKSAMRLFEAFVGTTGPMTIFVQGLTVGFELLNKMTELVPGLKPLLVTMTGLAAVSKLIGIRLGALPGLFGSLGRSAGQNMAQGVAGQATAAATSWRGKFMGVLKGLGWTAAAAAVFNGLSTALTEHRDLADWSGVEESLNDFGVGVARTFGGDLGQTTAERFSESFKSRMKSLSAGLSTFSVTSRAGETFEGQGFADAAKAIRENRADWMEAFNLNPRGIADMSARQYANMWTEEFSVEFERLTAKERFQDLWAGMTPDERVLAKEMNKAVNAAGNLVAKHGITLPPSFIRADPAGAKVLARRFEDGLSLLKSGAVTTWKDIQRIFKRNQQAIASSPELSGEKVRKLQAANYRETANALAASMKRSGNVTEKGMDRVKRLIRKADLAEGIRPREFGREFGKAFDRGEKVTGQRIDGIIDKLKQMPKKVRPIAFDTMMKQLREYKRGGDLSDKEFDKIRSRILSKTGDIRDKGSRDARQTKQNLSSTFDALTTAVTGSLSVLGINVNKMLTALDAKKLDFGFTKAKGNGGGGGGGGGGRQRGGPIQVPGVGVGDKVKMILGGQYVADVEPGEFVNITNRRAAREVSAINGMFPRFGGFQGGGAFQSRADVLGSGPGFVPYMNYLNSMFGPLNVISGARPGSITTSGNVSNHSWGGAVDISTPGGEGATAGNPMTGAMGARMDAAHRWIASKFAPINLDLLWRTMVGGNHYNHVHSGIARSHSFNAQAMSDFISRLPHGTGFSALDRMRITGPNGVLKDMGQEAVDKVWKAAQQYVSQQSMTPGFGTSRATADPHGRTGQFTSTAYGPPWGGINGMGVTATGVDLRGLPHTFGIATDPSVIPLGSKVTAWPNPHRHRGLFTAFDTGGAIQGNRIDFYDWSNPMAWGVKQTQVQGFQKGTRDRDKGGKPKGLDERKPKKYARLMSDVRKAMSKARRQLGRTDERLELAQTYAASEISPGGSELTARERTKQLKLLQRQFHLLKTVRGVARMGVKVQKRAGRPGGVWRDTLVEMEGLTGQGGRLFENRLMYRELKRTGLAGQTGLSIDQLVALREAFDRGIFPSFGDGGVFKAPAGQSSGLAELHDGERVLPEGGGGTVIYSDVYIGDGPARQLIAKGVRHEIKEVQIETARSAATGRLPK